MRLRLAAYLAGAATIVLAGASCHDTAAPTTSTLRGTYVAIKIDSASIPTRLPWDPSLPTEIIADTMSFDGQGHARHSWTLLETATGSLVNQVATPQYQVVGDSVHFVLECPPLAACIVAPPAGILGGGEWLLVGSPPSAYLYKRVQ